MWERKYSKLYPGVKKEAVWAAWADINNWAKWDIDTDLTELREPFQVGSTFILKPKGGPRFKLEITTADEFKNFTDLTRFPLARMYDIHELEETPQGLKISSTIQVKGPLAWLWGRLIGQQVANGTPRQLDALVKHVTSA